MSRFTSSRGRPPHPDLLTIKEWQVLAFLRKRLSNAEIAARMDISINTVKTHVSNILSKLDLTSRTDALAWPGMPGVWAMKSANFGESTMQLALYMSAIRVKALDSAVPFYDELLGQSGVLVSPGRHYYYLGGVALALREPYAHDLELLPNPDWIYIATDDLDKARSNAGSAGANVTEDIQEHPWGARSFYLRDPDGNGICFTQQETISRHDG